MEVALLSSVALRIKSKQAQVVVDPDAKISKMPADAVLTTQRNKKIDTARVEDYRLIVSGPGEYEVGGIKISVLALDDELAINLDVDGVRTLVISSQMFSKAKDKIKESHVLVLQTADLVAASLIKDFGPQVVLLYGEKAKESAKELGKDEVPAVKKYTTTLEKLPVEMEVLVLE